MCLLAGPCPGDALRKALRLHGAIPNEGCHWQGSAWEAPGDADPSQKLSRGSAVGQPSNPPGTACSIPRSAEIGRGPCKDAMAPGLRYPAAQAAQTHQGAPRVGQPHLSLWEGCEASPQSPFQPRE